MNEWLTVPEVAERLRCSVRSVHERTRRRALPMRKHGRTILFSAAELEAWLDGAPLEQITTQSGAVIVRPKPGQ